MVDRGYNRRIAESKSGIERTCEAMAEANPTLDAEELARLILDEKSIPITMNYAEELVQRFGETPSGPRR
ncbi:hypothetical protein [Rhizobium leguminosarum]|jgi:hypothetical protein|uniref:hypothetical protein n=1 Tax=Rhizobium leguminosarum TaxID=384 RepID=UPI002E114D9A|nr:hypothetical protein U8Q02_42155 [Rhizobium leguminosarum]